MAKITVKKPGTQMGCTDTGSPETCTEQQLSQVHDLLLAAQRLEDSATEEQRGFGMLTAQVFKLLPENIKLEFNYSNWKYRRVEYPSVTID